VGVRPPGNIEAIVGMMQVAPGDEGGPARR